MPFSRQDEDTQNTYMNNGASSSTSTGRWDVIHPELIEHHATDATKEEISMGFSVHYSRI